MKKIAFGCLRIAAVAGCLAAFIHTVPAAVAQTPPGCNPRVYDAMQKTAQARVAFDVARTEQVFPQPDSVLAMTCFNKAAGVSAIRGGELFSGSVATGQLSNVISDALSTMYRQFADSEGGMSGTVSYNSTYISNDPGCDGIGDFWSRIKQKGVEGGIPYMTFEDLRSGQAPANTGQRFQQNWNTAASDGVFTDVQQAYDNLPRATVPIFSDRTICGILRDGGVQSNCN